MGLKIKNIEYYLPANLVTNEDLQAQYPLWDVAKVGVKSGVLQRYWASDTETALDLASKAVSSLIESGGLDIKEVDGIIFCTQSPDFIMPSNAFLIHKAFGFRSGVWAFDYNLACSGFVYGLAIARGMFATGLANKILLINADTYSKYINKNDRSTSVLFGDGAAVTILENTEKDSVIDIALASEGSAFESFYIPAGGSRYPKSEQSKIAIADNSGNIRTDEDIHMNGFAVWKFISQTVPDQIKTLLKKNNMGFEDIDHIVFHQASKLTLDSLVKALGVDPEKIFCNLHQVGNTVSASIPIALKDAITANKIKRGDKILLSGFGVGLSWGSLILEY